MWILLNESKITNDRKELLKSFNKDISDEKFSPTEDFLVTAYDILNERFFNGLLPMHIEFKVSSSVTSPFIGLASYKFNRDKGTVWATSVTLNGSRKLSVHEWLEVVLHEMVHVYDYETNANHFLGYEEYDPHGEWFLTTGREFEPEGFHVQKFCDADIEMNTDDRRVQGRIANTLLLVLDGITARSGDPGLIAISKKDKDKYIDIFTKLGREKRIDGLKGLTIMKSDNPAIASLSKTRMRDERSSFGIYGRSEGFENKYGPFEEVEHIDLSTVTEDKDETEYDDMNRIEDDYARHIYDSIEGVVDVKRTGKDEYEVSIA